MAEVHPGHMLTGPKEEEEDYCHITQLFMYFLLFVTFKPLTIVYITTDTCTFAITVPPIVSVRDPRMHHKH
jgi:hypothetical protein